MKYTGFIIVILALFSPLLSNAQDGAGLFKSKCNICHLVDKNSTGPILKGVKAKWEGAGEGEFLYEWVKDPQALIESGKSELALVAEQFSSSAMTPQDLTNEEIDAILNYVDTYVPTKAPPVATTPSAEVPVTYVPNYDQNLNLFYALSCLTLVLLFAIIIMAGSLTRFINSDYFKKNAKDKSNNPFLNTILLVIGFTALMANNSNALTFIKAGETAEESGPWLIVENVDIYVMIFVNVVLLFVLFYIRRLFKGFVYMTKKEVEAEQVQEADEVIKKVNKILTDIVPIEEEHTILLHHEYDGIKELDNNLPPWWVWLFFATILFGVVYMFNYHILKTGDLQIEEYTKDVQRAEKEIDAYRKANAMDITAENVTLLNESDDLSKGKALYNTNCSVCHEANGGGQIGPNLTDKSWIYGYDISDVFTSIQEGRPNGMREHASILNPIQIQQIASFVLSLPEVEGKEAEGEIIKK